ncbi:DNRLRE domain-containing protein [Vibrio coralliilyticus]|uniref:DNRLRE domain-containing protein n=1 Tax=Vibrio coralliilyticus TaxID=190893 RepID=UPI0024096D6E|nr:DNRLRE domain-containing protein [Vibrio coralliilyticus]WFB46439.1 DNRLRE domain-containing protein [Vibrio coralliilyticus]
MIRRIATLSLIAVAGLTSLNAGAATQYHRVVWDSDPAREAVIGFSPNGESEQPYVQYGTSTDEATWLTKQPSYEHVFGGDLLSYFVRLDNLTPDSPVYYRVCDQQGCGERFWFRTAPIDNSEFVMIAGGDTRTGWTNRRMGNQLVAKVRPLFILHGGDYTSQNSASQMAQYLEDWALTFSSDQIDGKAYKRTYPFIPTHGNHEDYDYSTLCKVFGVDADGNGECNPFDTYNVVNISPLLRVYTLNSQFRKSGWSSYASQMNEWLEQDLATHGDENTWRVAQYHRPMFPHVSSKSDSPDLFSWWAELFYQHSMNLVVESDSHLTKATRELKPDGNDFVSSPTGGTVYIGEGSWGAAARSANDPKSWTLDAASIQQVKVIQVLKDSMTVRTAQFDASASTLTREERETDSLRLPENVNWWSLNEVGETMELVQSADRLSILKNQDPDTSPSFIRLPATQDVFVAQSQPDTNFDEHEDGLLADASDSTYGSTMSLMTFDVSSIPTCVDIAGVKLELQVTNKSYGEYGVHVATEAWKDSSATWNSVDGEQIAGRTLTHFIPSSTGTVDVDLTDSHLLDLWDHDGNFGLVIASAGTTDGVDFDSSETGTPPALVVSYNERKDCETPINSLSLPTSGDTFIASSKASENFNNHADGLLADLLDTKYGKTNALIKFDVSALPEGVEVDSVVLALHVTNASTGNFELYRVNKNWNEQTATWQSIYDNGGSGDYLTTFSPKETGVYRIDLTNSGLLQSWLNGENTGLIIVPKSLNGLDISSRELGMGPVLTVTYH